MGDSRCGGATALFIDSQGDMYVTATSAYGAFHMFPSNPDTMPPACLLRIEAGTTVFDPNYYVNLLDKLGTQAVFQSWYVGNDKMLMLALKANSTFTDINDFYANAQFVPLLVDTQGNSTPVTTLPTTTALNTYEFTLNGNLIYQSYDVLATAQNLSAVTIYGVDADGSTTQYFSATGDFWGIGSLTLQN